MTNNQKNYARAMAIEKKNKERILAVNSEVREVPGIYILNREENGFKYAYVGQAKRLLTRLAQHLAGYDQHIDLSLKKRGFANDNNPIGWHIIVKECDESVLNSEERDLIQMMAAEGFQMLNVTSGGQDGGKFDIGERKAPRGYREGVKQGERNAIKQIAHLFDKHIKAVPKADKPSKTAINALEKFYEIIGVEEYRK